MKKISICKKIGMVAIAAAMVSAFVGCSGTTGTSGGTEEEESSTTYNISGSVELSIKTAPTSTSDSAACKLGLFTEYSAAATAPTFTFTSFSIKVGDTSYNKEISSATLEKNGDYGWQWVGDVMNGTNLAEGDTVTVSFEGTSNVECTAMQAFFVDNTSAASWWKTLCDTTAMTWSCVDASAESVK